MKLIYCVIQSLFAYKVTRYKLSCEKMLPQISQLYVQIGRIILSKILSNTLRFPDANLLVLPSRVYISLLALLLLNVYFEIPIVCYNSSQIWIQFTNFKWFLFEAGTNSMNCNCFIYLFIYLFFDFYFRIVKACKKIQFKLFFGKISPKIVACNSVAKLINQNQLPRDMVQFYHIKCTHTYTYIYISLD